jgi:hypothetical protein
MAEKASRADPMRLENLHNFHMVIYMKSDVHRQELTPPLFAAPLHCLAAESGASSRARFALCECFWSLFRKS